MEHYLIKFSKGGNIKFISHLDLMRTLQRIIRRANLPIAYSHGFNPHMDLSLAQPLSVGMYSKGEYMNVVFTEPVKEEEIIERLNAASQNTIEFYHVSHQKVVQNEKIWQAMALLDAARYSITIKYEDTNALKARLEELKKEEKWLIVKKTKSGEKEVDIKHLVYKFDYSIGEKDLLLQVLLACGSKENLSAELLSNYIKNNTEAVKADSFVDILREEMYFKSGDKYIPLYKYLETKKK